MYHDLSVVVSLKMRSFRNEILIYLPEILSPFLVANYARPFQGPKAQKQIECVRGSGVEARSS